MEQFLPDLALERKAHGSIQNPALMGLQLRVKDSVFMRSKFIVQSIAQPVGRHPWLWYISRTMDIKSLEKHALELPVLERARLAQELLASLDALSESEREQLWLDEAARRAWQLDAGEVALIPGDEVAQKARNLLR